MNVLYLKWSSKLLADDHVNMRSLEWALIQHDCLLIKRGNSDTAGMWVMPLQTSSSKGCQQPAEADGHGTDGPPSSSGGTSLAAILTHHHLVSAKTNQPFLFLVPLTSPLAALHFLNINDLKIFIYFFFFFFYCTKILLQIFSCATVNSCCCLELQFPHQDRIWLLHWRAEFSH